MLTQQEMEYLDRFRKIHEQNIDSLCRHRLGRLKEWWQTKFHRRHKLELVFGMGTCLIKINEESLFLFYEENKRWEPRYKGRTCLFLNEVLDAIEDIEEITNFYRITCPEDVTVYGSGW